MFKYYIFLTICLLFLNCKTTYYTSLFKKIPGNQGYISKDILSKKNYQEELALKNNFKILLKESDIINVKFSLYLKNSPLYQSQINAGIEKIILIYIKNIIIDKCNTRLKTNPYIEIFSNKDVTSLSFFTDKDNVKQILNIIAESIKITSFNLIDINKIKDEQYKLYNQKQNELFFYLDSKFERHVFKSSPVQIPFDGNSISLKIMNLNDITNYYKNYFNTKRMALLIYGNITKKDFLVSDFNLYENLNFNSNIPDTSYEKMESKFFIAPPVYYNNQSNDNQTYYEAIYNSPSFLNDDYFAFLIANNILKDNLFNCTDIIDPIDFSPQMLNITNFGKLRLKSVDKNTINTLLSFKKILLKTKKGIGVFYYWKDTVKNAVKDYGTQDEDNVYVKSLSSVIDNYKNNIFENFNFTNLNNPEKERNFISIYFLLNQIIDSSTIKERIDSISENDIIKIYQKYFNNFTWSVLSSEKIMNNLSQDFF